MFKQKQAVTKDDVSDEMHLQKEDIPVSIAFKSLTVNQYNEMILQVKNFYVEKAEVACITRYNLEIKTDPFRSITSIDSQVSMDGPPNLLFHC